MRSPPEQLQIEGTEAMIAIAINIWRRPPMKGRKVGTLRMEGGRVRFDQGLPPSLARFLPRFKCRARDGTVLTIEDGEAWLRALPANLHGLYLWAGFNPGTRIAHLPR